MEINQKKQEELKKEKPLFEMVDMGYIAVEFGFALAIIFSISMFLYHDGSFQNMSLFLKTIMPLMIIREIWIFYKAFIQKKYHLKFYKDGIYRVETDEFLPLASIKKGNDVFWSPSSHKPAYWTLGKIILIIIAIPFWIFHSFLVVARGFTSMWYLKSIFTNQYSLIVTFDDETKKEKEQVINIPYGYLKKEELEFIKNYFAPYFDINSIEKSFLNLPEKPEIN